MPTSLAKNKVGIWIKNLPLSRPQRSTVTANFDKVATWWQQESDSAIDAVRKVAVMTGSPATMIHNNVHMDSLRRITSSATSQETQTQGSVDAHSCT